MKKNYIAIILSLSIVSLPALALAAGLIPSDADIAKDGFGAFAQLINNIINWFIGISVSVAACTFAYAGAQMLLNPGVESKRSEAKEMFRKTIWGMVIILGAWVVVHSVVSTFITTPGALRFLKG